MTKQAWPRPPVRRIGMLTPSSNTVLESTTSALIQRLSGSVTVHFSRFPVTVISDTPESHRQFQVDHMVAAARLLADARVDAIVQDRAAIAELIEADLGAVCRGEAKRGQTHSRQVVGGAVVHRLGHPPGNCVKSLICPS